MEKNSHGVGGFFRFRNGKWASRYIEIKCEESQHTKQELSPHCTQRRNKHENIAALPTVGIYFTELCGPIISHALNIEEICVLRKHTCLCDSRMLWTQQNKSQGSDTRFCSNQKSSKSQPVIDLSIILEGGCVVEWMEVIFHAQIKKKIRIYINVYYIILTKLY